MRLAGRVVGEGGERLHQGEPLLRAYRETWLELSENSLDLSHFYAAQRLVMMELLDWRRVTRHDGKVMGQYTVSEEGLKVIGG